MNTGWCKHHSYYYAGECPCCAEVKRTNEPTRSPQEPFVQQSATADSEHDGVVVQGSMDEPDRKAFSVQQSATIAFSVDEWRAFAEVMHDLTWGKSCMSLWHSRVREPMEAKAKQVAAGCRNIAETV
jgi:hypothetical protein